MARILVVSDSIFLRTGFSNVGRNICWALHNAGHKVFHLGFSDPRPDKTSKKWAGFTYPWDCLSTRNTHQDKFAQSSYGEHLLVSNPDLVIIVADIWNVGHLLTQSKCQSIVVTHIEGAPLPTKMPYVSPSGEKETNIPDILLKASYIVNAGPFGRKQIQDRLIEYAKYLKCNDADIEKLLKNTNCMIPDGIDTDVFKPVDVSKIKKQLFKDIPDDAFIIGYFGRQNVRKGLPYALEAFAQWPDRPKNAYIYLHTALRDRNGWNIPQLLNDLKITDRVITDKKLMVGQGCSDEILNYLYNACDVMLFPTMGEGASLTCLEACSSGTPVITTNYAEAPNYIGKVAELVEPVAFHTDPITNVRRAIPSIDQCVRKLNMFYNEPNRKQIYGTKARDLIVQYYDNKVVHQKWVELVNKIVSKQTKPVINTQSVQTKSISVNKSDKKKILFVGSYFLPDLLGGGEITYDKILRDFMKRGWDAHVIICRDGINEEVLSIDGIHIIRSNKVNIDTKLPKYISEIKPDVVITTLIDPGMTKIALHSAKVNGATTVYYEQFYNSICTKYKDVMNISHESLAPWGHDILSMVDHIYTNGQFVHDAMLKHQGFDSNILHPYIDLNECKVDKVDAPHDLITMINPDPGKGGDTLSYMVSNMPRFKFLTVKVSSGAKYSNLPKDIDNLEIWDFQKDTRKIYERTKVLLMPTVVDETFGRVIIEAQSNGIPIIGRDVGNIKDTVGEGGIIIDKNEDDDKWCEVLYNLLNDKDEYTRLSNMAKENVKRFDFNKELDSFFKSLENSSSKIVSKTQHDIVCISPNFPSVVGVFERLEKLFSDQVLYINTTHTKTINNTLKEIVAQKPKRVILGAWDPNYPQLMNFLKRELPGVELICAWFSNFSQMDFSVNNELSIFAHLKESLESNDKIPVNEIWMSSQVDANLLNTINDKIKYIPCPIVKHPTSDHVKSDKIKVSLFCAPGPRKNLSSQILAMVKIPNVELHLNGLTKRAEFAKILKLLNIKYVDHGWMNPVVYQKVISEMDVCLQTTFAETFNYVACEHMMNGIPVVGSKMVPVINEDDTFKDLIVVQADNPTEIAEKVIFAYENRDEYSKKSIEFIHRLADQSYEKLKDLLRLNEGRK